MMLDPINPDHWWHNCEASVFGELVIKYRDECPKCGARKPLTEGANP